MGLLHLAARDMGRKLGSCALLGTGSWVPIQHSVARAEVYPRASLNISCTFHYVPRDSKSNTSRLFGYPRANFSRGLE